MRLAVLASLLLFAPAVVHADVYTFDVALGGSEVVNGSPYGVYGTGTATVTVDDATGTVDFVGTYDVGSSYAPGYARLRGPAPRGAVGANSYLITFIGGPPVGNWAGSVTMSPTEIEELLDDLWYLTLDDLFGVGPIMRGQIDAYPIARPYGCGVNPDGSLLNLGGDPLIGANLVLGMDNPLGTQSPGSISTFDISLAPAPGYPCGIILPGYGMGGAGELLIDLTPGVYLPPALIGGLWSGPGNPATISIPIPSDSGLVGERFYVTGVLVDLSGTGVRFALTTALLIRPGA